MIQIVQKNRVFWCGTVREVTEQIKELSKEYFLVKDLINAKLH
ncbi:MAG: hypothetical protein PWQ96_324 [Clostridia bacterium]|jgi:hypothetical protein|nr:hypothetical protein [Clostridia bacterium]